MRKPFTAANVPEIDKHLQERLRQVEDNFGDDKAYPSSEKREILLRIVFMPNKKVEGDVDIAVFSDVKLPKRRGNPTAGVLRNGKILLEDFPEEQPLFDTSRPRVVGGEDE